MRDNHIIAMLEERSPGALSESEAAAAEAHAAVCDRCRQAYEAARVSQLLIRARAAEAVEPSPFFKTRVMAAIRERQLSPELPAIVRMWRAAGALVSGLAVMVALLVGMTLYGIDSQQVQSADLAATQSIFSPEYVVLELSSFTDEGMAYDQVLDAMYNSEETVGQ